MWSPPLGGQHCTIKVVMGHYPGCLDFGNLDGL
jgi:hypothetical protein